MMVAKVVSSRLPRVLNLKVQLHVTKSENQQALVSALSGYVLS
jgi:hypothetical protein